MELDWYREQNFSRGTVTRKMGGKGHQDKATPPPLL